MPGRPLRRTPRRLASARYSWIEQVEVIPFFVGKLEEDLFPFRVLEALAVLLEEPVQNRARTGCRSSALMIGIRCERGSHRFFKRYGERFEDSEGQADLPGVRRRRAESPRPAVREYRALAKRQGRSAAAAARGHPLRGRPAGPA